LERSGEIVDGLPLANIESKLRKQIIQFFGRDSAESIAVAQQLHASIWTDDRLVAEAAKAHTSVERIWSEVLFQWGTDIGRIDGKRRDALIARLVRIGYRHTRLFPDVAVAMASEAGWDFRREPFRTAIDWIGEAGVDADSIQSLAEVLLPKVYGIPNKMLANMTSVNLIGSIGKRRDGRHIIRNLRRRAGIYCGMDFTTENRLRQDLDIWLDVTRN
jgi:hypothetical protein